MSAIPDYRNADELIKNHFRGEETDFEHNLSNLDEFTREWLYAAYLQGVEEGFEEGEREGYDTGYDIGRSDGYDEGYDDARAEFESDEW